MEIITSSQNQWVMNVKKLHQKKYRESQGLFLAEGLRLVEEAAKGGRIHQVFFHESLEASQRGRELLKKLTGVTRSWAETGVSCPEVGGGLEVFQVSGSVLSSLAETQTPQGIVAVVEQPHWELAQFEPEGQGPLILLDGLQDPGNLGAILRSLWAVGGEGLLCLKGTAEAYNSKAVRASMGGIFAVPVLQELTWPQVDRWAQQRGYLTVAGDLRQAVDYRQVPWQPRTLLCIGNEAQGLLTVPANQVKVKAMIPLAHEAESLNAAVAAGILLYEAVRARK